MFRLPSIRLGRVLGVPIELNVSWFAVFALVGWTLAVDYFPAELPGRPPWQHAALGVVTAALFFASVVAHELGHSMVARRQGLRVEGVTLFLFGGVARLSEEPRSAGGELVMALAGPLTSVLLASLGLGLTAALSAARADAAVRAPVAALAVVNLSVALFNLAPGFPMDGGRVVRSFLWWASGDKRLATRLASAGGQLIGLAIAGLGVWQVATGALEGAWYVLLGLFLRSLASRAYTMQAPLLALERTAAGSLATGPLPVALADADAGAFVDARESLVTVATRMQTEGRPFVIVVSDGRAVGAISSDVVGRALIDAASEPRGRRFAWWGTRHS